MNTSTLGCQHANQDLVLPLLVETHKGRQYAVHVQGASLGYGEGPSTLSVMLCLTCGQVFVPQDQLEEFLDARTKAKEHEAIVRRLRVREEAERMQQHESIGSLFETVLGHTRVPPDRRPK